MSTCKCGREAGLLSDVCSVCQGVAERHEELVDTMSANTEAMEEAARVEREALEEHQAAIETALERAAEEQDRKLNRAAEEQERNLSRATEEQRRNLDRAAEKQKQNLADAWKLEAASKLKQARELYEAGLLPDALAQCVEAIKSDRSNIQGYILGGEIVAELKPDKENECLQKALALLKVGENKISCSVHMDVYRCVKRTGNIKMLSEWFDIFSLNSQDRLFFKNGQGIWILHLADQNIPGTNSKIRGILENYINSAVAAWPHGGSVLLGIAIAIELDKRTIDESRLNSFLPLLRNMPSVARERVLGELANINKTYKEHLAPVTMERLSRLVLERYKEWGADIVAYVNNAGRERATLLQKEILLLTSAPFPESFSSQIMDIIEHYVASAVSGWIRNPTKDILPGMAVLIKLNLDFTCGLKNHSLAQLLRNLSFTSRKEISRELAEIKKHSSPEVIEQLTQLLLARYKEWGADIEAEIYKAASEKAERAGKDIVYPTAIGWVVGIFSCFLANFIVWGLLRLPNEFCFPFSLLAGIGFGIGANLLLRASHVNETREAEIAVLRRTEAEWLAFLSGVPQTADPRPKASRPKAPPPSGVGVRPCPACGKLRRDDELECGWCGNIAAAVVTNVKESKNTSPKEEIQCPRCGKRIEGDSVFCGYCRAKVIENGKADAGIVDGPDEINPWNKK